MPGFGTTFGKAEAKVQDENGTVYSYDFVLSGKIKREYKKNPETEFLLIKLDEKKKCIVLHCQKKITRRR